MSHTTVPPHEAVDFWWRQRGITACILMEERIALKRARDKFWGRA